MATIVYLGDDKSVTVAEPGMTVLSWRTGHSASF